MNLSETQDSMVGRRRFLAFGAVAASMAIISPKLAAAQEQNPDFYQCSGAVVAQSNMLSWQFTEVSRLTSNASPSDYADLIWRIDVLSPFSVASAAQVTLPKLTPPPAFADVHHYLAQAVDELVNAGSLFRTGVLNLDVASISLAAEAVNRSTELIAKATAAIPAGVPALS